MVFDETVPNSQPQNSSQVKAGQMLRKSCSLRFSTGEKLKIVACTGSSSSQQLIFHLCPQRRSSERHRCGVDNDGAKSDLAAGTAGAAHSRGAATAVDDDDAVTAMGLGTVGAAGGAAACRHCRAALTWGRSVGAWSPPRERGGRQEGKRERPTR